MKDMESQGKWFGLLRSAFCFQQSDHHLGSRSKEGLHPSLYDLGLERPKVDTLPHCDQLIDAPLQGSPTGTFLRSLCPLRSGDGRTQWQDSSHATLVVDHGMARLSISLSQITLISLLVVQVPTNKGTLHPKLDSSGTTRNTASSSYPATPHTCTCKMTNPSGLVCILPNPMRFTG